MVIHHLPNDNHDPTVDNPEEATFRSSGAKPPSQQPNNNSNNNNSLLLLTSPVENQAAHGLCGLSSAANGFSGAVTEQELLVPNSTTTIETSNSLWDSSSTTARVSNLFTEFRTETSRDSQPQENSVLPPASNGGHGVLLSTTNETRVPILAADEVPSEPDVTTANNSLSRSETGVGENAVATLTTKGEMASQSLTTCGIADESKNTDHGFSTVCLTTDEKIDE